jgi:hypothetical protein
VDGVTPQQRARGAAPEVHHITGARTAHSDDFDHRVRRYLFSMAVRTVCVVLAVVVSGPLRWVFVVGAVLLPYVAVVMANAVGERRTAGPAPVAQEARPMLPAVAEGAAAPPVIILYDDLVGTPDPSPEQVIRGSGEQTA